MDEPVPTPSAPPGNLHRERAARGQAAYRSLAPRATLKLPLEGRVITASSLAVGTTPPCQLVVESQLPPVGAAVVFHVIVDSNVRSSRSSVSRPVL